MGLLFTTLLRTPLPPTCAWIPPFPDGLCICHNSPSYAEVTNHPQISMAYNDKGLLLTHITSPSWVTAVPSSQEQADCLNTASHHGRRERDVVEHASAKKSHVALLPLSHWPDQSTQSNVSPKGNYTISPRKGQWGKNQRALSSPTSTGQRESSAGQ